MKKNLKYFNPIHPLFFWSFILILAIGMAYLNNSILDTNVHTSQLQNTIEKQSYQNSKASADIIDLNALDYTDIKLEKEKSSLENFYTTLKFRDNLSVIALLIYSIILSALFTYREKSNRRLLMTQEAKMDQLKIDIARKESKVSIYDEIEKGLFQYKNILSPELNLVDLDQQINKNTNYIIFSSRVALEKILLQICSHNNISNDSLSDMIMILYKQRILNVRTNSYAHTIKAFGNRVAHPNITNPISYDAQDALLVLSTLLTLLKELESNNLLESLQNVA